MAVTDIEINATAKELEDAAKAKKYTDEDIIDLVYPIGRQSVLIFSTPKTDDTLKKMFPGIDFDDLGTITTSSGASLYVYSRVW